MRPSHLQNRVVLQSSNVSQDASSINFFAVYSLPSNFLHSFEASSATLFAVIYRRKSLSGSWKTNVGDVEIQEVTVQDKYKKWIDEASSIFGGLELCSLEAIVDGAGVYLEIIAVVLYQAEAVSTIVAMRHFQLIKIWDKKGKIQEKRERSGKKGEKFRGKRRKSAHVNIGTDTPLDV